MTPLRLVWVRRGGWRSNGGERMGVTRQSPLKWLVSKSYFARSIRRLPIGVSVVPRNRVVPPRNFWQTFDFYHGKSIKPSLVKCVKRERSTAQNYIVQWAALSEVMVCTPIAVAEIDSHSFSVYVKKCSMCSSSKAFAVCLYKEHIFFLSCHFLVCT